MEKSSFLKKVKVEYLVDDSSEKKGKDFFGFRIMPPEALLDSDFPVLIATVQNAPKILDNFYKLGLKESRLIKERVI